MDIISDDQGSRIARRIRLERDARAWSQADLALRSGVSKAMISKIEREEVSPTAVILVRLSGAFDLTLAGLLLRAEGEAGRLSRRAEQPVGAIPARVMCAGRCSVGPIIPWNSSGSRCRPDRA